MKNKSNKKKSKKTEKPKTENTESNGRNPDGTFAKGNNFGKHDNREHSLVEEFKRRLKQTPTNKKKQLKEIWVDRWIHLAVVEGDWNALREGIRYIDGMPKQQIENSGEQTITIKKSIFKNKKDEKDSNTR